MDNKEVRSLFIRYIILIIVAFPNLYLFYLIFTPITVLPVYLILKFIYGATLSGYSTIVIQGQAINLISACIAGAAYYLLLILNLSTPMNLKKRLKSLIFIALSFLILNIIRILIFSSLYLSGFQYFDLAHKIIWYAGSTILIVLIWFLNIWLFKIRNIPIYTDIKSIAQDIRKRKSKELIRKTGRKKQTRRK